MRVRISCSTKFWAFNLAEQLERNELLDQFYTLYFSQKDWYYNRFHSRKDKEHIPVQKVGTFPLLLPFFYRSKDMHDRAVKFDNQVAARLRRNKNYETFIGWSGMSYQSMLEAKKHNKLCILERGSSHINIQNRILREEYKQFGIDFSIDERIVQQEIREYELADFIVVPSKFVFNSFIEQGFSGSKLVINNFGIGSYFSRKPKSDTKFRILYLGGLSVRKGLRYLFEALDKLTISSHDFEVLFVGTVDSEIEQLVPNYKKSNWTFTGHINHYELPQYISQCDIAVHPSVEEGLSMVIPQMMGCGIPVIATTNTGGEDVIDSGVNGFIVPIRNADAIAEKIEWYFNNPERLAEHKANAENKVQQNYSWQSYGDRYSNFLKSIY